MITIFHGRKLSLHGSDDVVYAEVAVALRDQIHHFNTGKSCTPFAIFMKIALHTDEYGWAFPGKAEISRKTGVTSADAIAHSLRHLQDMRIEGQRILEVWRERRPDGTFGRCLYRIFPGAWTDGLAHLPESFRAESLTPVDPDRVLWQDPHASPGPAAKRAALAPNRRPRTGLEQQQVNAPDSQGPDREDPDPLPPGPEEPDPDLPDPEGSDLKKNQSINQHQETRSGSAGFGSTTTDQRSDKPLVKGESPPRVQGTDAAAPFEPCDLARFVEAHSRYRFQPGAQHDRLLRAVPHRDRPHPAPNDLYRDERQGEAFRAWVLSKIEWAQGHPEHRKPLQSLVSAICNYAQPQFGWFVFWNEWLDRQQGGKHERRGAPGDSDRTRTARDGPPGTEHRAEQRHWAQVQRYLAGCRALAAAGRPLD